MLHYNQDILMCRSNLEGTTNAFCPSSQTEPPARNLFHRQRHLYSGDSRFPGSHGLSSTGGHGLHIAHMLWGGLLILIALVLLLAFIGRHLQSSTALLSGIGFGTFIDELGKFISIFLTQVFLFYIQQLLALSTPLLNLLVLIALNILIGTQQQKAWHAEIERTNVS